MGLRRIAAVVVGVLLALPALGLLAGGAALTVGYAIEHDDDGYFDATLERLSTATAEITTGEVDLRADPGPPDRVLNFPFVFGPPASTRVPSCSLGSVPRWTSRTI